VVFEFPSLLCEIAPDAFSFRQSLQSIAIPSSVRILARDCFSTCRSLRSVTFELPSRLAAIERGVFFHCQSLNRFLIPASVTAIDESAFWGSRIGSIGIEEGSISFRVLNEFLVDFEVRSLVLVIGSPESIQIPSSIEELRPDCCGWKCQLRTVGFEFDSNPRSIGEFAFVGCEQLESLFIPSSVEVLGKCCFTTCSSLRTVTFGAESKLRVIEGKALEGSPSVKLDSVPASAEVVRADDSDDSE
jgi:hypothetical protein